MTKLMRSISFTDLHWGRRNSSEVHNRDCLAFIEWFCEQVKAQRADHIIFMGDWFETRSSINVHTLNYAHVGMTLLNSLGIPIFMVVGNHDLYFKNTRDVHSLVSYAEFENVRLITDITVVPEIGDGALLCPYLFHHEYEELKKYTALKTWWGHFEFQGFVITGQNHKMMTGPLATEFVEPLIFSGHFHKRQQQNNVVYTGNCFPMDYSDSGDYERGATVYDHHTNTFQFLDWADCPKYQRVMLSDLIDKGPEGIIHRGARVRCYVDREINYEESMSLKEVILEEYDLREFVLEEVVNLDELARGSDVSFEQEEGLEDLDHLVVRILGQLQTEKIKPNRLVDIYNSLELPSE